MNRFMKVAIDEARKGIKYNHGGPFGSVVVKDGKIVGRGHNRVVQKNDPTLHGEVVAIKDACKNLGTFDLTGCEIYTTSEPCPMCMGAVMWANIERIYSGCDVKDAEKIGFRDQKFYKRLKTKDEIQVECDRDECWKVFQEYYDMKNKTEY